jgi:hypothetical protein
VRYAAASALSIMTKTTWMTVMNTRLDPNFDRELECPLIGGSALWKALGYPSANAFSQSARRGTTPVPVFSLHGRRGQYALRKDVLAWLASLPSLAERATSEPAQTEGRMA